LDGKNESFHAEYIQNNILEKKKTISLQNYKIMS
jgi:hypothetical protein